MAKNVCVTGATGFIGAQLVKRLSSRGDQVTCFVRPTSCLSGLKDLNCRIVVGDIVKEPSALVEAISNVETVYHVAASTHAVRSRDLIRVNTEGTNNVLKACASRQSPPTVVFVSSLAANGPCSGSRPHEEDASRNPVSNYGRSKAACELNAIEYANRIPISIVRPPIVLGGGDRQGLAMFQLIDRWGWHIVPGFVDRLFSVIHVDDLATVLMGVADRGQRLVPDSASQGVYFASDDEIFTYAGLGKLIGKALGRSRTRILRVGKPAMWVAAAANELVGRASGSAQFVNLDKAKEAFAGSWTCSNKKIRDELGIIHAVTMQERMEQTVDWYRKKGWLKQQRVTPYQAAKSEGHTEEDLEHVR